MNPNDNDDPLATQSASPSSAEPAGASAPFLDPRHTYPRSSAAAQLRDPDRYQIINEHGRGGLGRVSRAHDLDLGRDVAIKELISRGNLSEVRFLREALITARLEHPGIVPVHEAGRWPDGTPFYAMKLVAGRPLRDLIAERKTVTERIGLLHHVIAVADAIAYAHGRNIIHRDLKPANVIVGDFGETIVIDWGLAKDLSTTEDATIGGGPFRAIHDTDLTSTGSVLGTPAYMAPEQERGEHVDQRADVFAIGAMLWELCSLQKVPPTDHRLRHRMLRRASIDRDLITIIDQALAPDAVNRYPDAGALASDLKAFKSGARIAARTYSPFAMLTHWARRHRALTLASIAAITILTTGCILYVKNIASERDRADTSEEIAKRSQASAETAFDELTLQHAELLLTTDPSAVLGLLSAYHGGRRDAAARIRAEAIGRGVALLRAKPHTDRIQWAAGTADQSIVSLSVDGTIARTTQDQRSTVLATGVSPKGRLAYAPSRGLLAYGCDPAAVCILDVLQGVKIAPTAELQDWQLASLAFSPDGTKLALLSYSGLIRVFDVSDPAHPHASLEAGREHGVGLLFADNDTIVVGLETPLSIELIRMNGESQTLAIHDHFMWEAIPMKHQLVLITQQGEGLHVDRNPLRILNRATLCHGSPTGVKILSDQHTAAYSCEEGTVGIWDLKGPTPVPLTHMEGHTDRISVSQSGDYLFAAGGNGTLAVIDLYTNVVSTYRGHSFSLTSISPPTATFPYLISADMRGSLRAWPLPNRIARVLSNVHTRFASAVFSQRSSAVIATTFRPELSVFSPLGQSGVARPHLANATALELSDNGHTLAAYGSGESVEFWTTQSLIRKRVINTGQGTISRVAFIRQSEEFVTAGRDGTLIYWTATAERKRTIKFPKPIANFILIPNSEYAVINTSDGALSRSDANGGVAALRDAGVQVVRMQNIPGTGSIALAYANGDVTVLDTTTWQENMVFHATQAVRDIAITPDGGTIAIADSEDVVHVGQLHGLAWTGNQVLWTKFSSRAHKLALTSDGLLIAICTDGAIWLYSLTRRDWLCLPTGTADLTVVAASSDGKMAATFDTDGRVLWLDLELAKKIINNRSQL